MKHLASGAIAVLVSLVALTASADERVDMLAEKTMALVETMANVIDRDKADCDKMGTDLNALLDANAGLIREAEAAHKKLSPEQRRVFLDKYRARVQAATAKMQGGITRCASNAKVTAALSRIPRG
jgi:hypothetical protein